MPSRLNWRRPAIALLLLLLSCRGVDENRSISESMTSTAIGSDAVAGPTSSMASTTTSTPQPPTTVTTTTIPPTTTTLPTSTPYVVPVEDVAAAGWGRTHSGYAATDIFLGCGSRIVSPVNGVVLEVRRENLWNPSTDNPAHRGGLYVSLRGDDGVRYYMAHFEAIDGPVQPGARVTVGQALGFMGQTGRASACHLHFAISPPCTQKEWAVRRGVVWPYPYLDDWKAGIESSPAAEVAAWERSQPGACAIAAGDPHAAES